MKTKEYVKFNNFKPITLEGIYSGDITILNNLKYNIEQIVNTEAPITMNILKARLREAFNVKKISQKALDIIEDKIKELGLIKTDNLYDKVLWPSYGITRVDSLRVGYERQIYDIPYQEMYILVATLDMSNEELYRSILSYFGYEVLTEKARTYLEYIEKMCK